MTIPAIYKPNSSTANATVSAQIVTNWSAELELSSAYYSHTADNKDRWAHILLNSQLGKYQLFKVELVPNGAVTKTAPVNYSTLSAAADAASAFLNTATD